jgi:hypothetical protein
MRISKDILRKKHGPPWWCKASLSHTFDKNNMRATALSFCLLLMLTGDGLGGSGRGVINVLCRSPDTCTQDSLTHASCLCKNIAWCCVSCRKWPGRRHTRTETSNTNHRGVEVRRRGTLVTWLAGAAWASHLAWSCSDGVLHAVENAIVTASGGMYEWVLAFGNKNRGAAIAFEELTAWIATRQVVMRREFELLPRTVSVWLVCFIVISPLQNV